MAEAEAETETEVKVVAPKQPSANGVTRPKNDTKTGRVWAIADELSSKDGPAARKDVMQAGEAEGLNTATIATQYGRWRKFHGLGRTVKAADTEDAAEVEEE